MSSWHESDFRQRERKHPRRWIGRGVGLCTFLTLLLLLNEQRRDGVRCDQDCYGTYRTYEPGHAWTDYDDSWQWDGQNIVMTIAFLLSVAALVFLLGGKRRRAVLFTVASLACSAAFITWVQLSPAIG